MHWLCLLVGFLGMYGLCRRLGIRAEVCWATACLFCYIPFYPTYGLAALGQPLLVLCALRLGDRTAGLAPVSAAKSIAPKQGRSDVHAALPAKAAKKDGPPRYGTWRKISEIGRWYLAIALYGACSSLTLIGYVWIVTGLLWTLFLAVSGYRKKSGFGPAFRVGGGTLVLLGVYLGTNQDLLRALTGSGFTTHRQEMVLQATEHPLASFQELIFSGGSYSPVYSAGILTAAVLLTLAALLHSIQSRKKKTETIEAFQGQESHSSTTNLKSAWALLALIFCAASLAVLWNSSPIVSLRLSIGGVVTYFQADRIYWCFPFLWMLALGLLLEHICKSGERLFAEKAILKRIIPILCCLLLLAIEGLQILRDSPLNKNIRLMLLKNYEQITWESIYMDEVFARIDQAIGSDKDHYSVVSLGIYPSIALYHNYTCADGYSNNYDLTYKHQFRQIMAKELEENPESLRYFDDWGNRLYLTGAPYGMSGMVPKAQLAYTDLDYDLDAMQALNICYILSAAPVELSSASLEQTNLRLELLEGSPFTDDTAYYEVWIYQITSPSES